MVWTLQSSQLSLGWILWKLMIRLYHHQAAKWYDYSEPTSSLQLILENNLLVLVAFLRCVQTQNKFVLIAWMWHLNCLCTLFVFIGNVIDQSTGHTEIDDWFITWKTWQHFVNKPSEKFALLVALDAKSGITKMSLGFILWEPWVFTKFHSKPCLQILSHPGQMKNYFGWKELCQESKASPVSLDLALLDTSYLLHSGTKGKVRGSPKLGFILWGPWIFVHNSMALYPGD